MCKWAFHFTFKSKSAKTDQKAIQYVFKNIKIVQNTNDKIDNKMIARWRINHPPIAIYCESIEWPKFADTANRIHLISTRWLLRLNQQSHQQTNKKEKSFTDFQFSKNQIQIRATGISTKSCHFNKNMNTTNLPPQKWN